MNIARVRAFAKAGPQTKSEVHEAVEQRVRFRRVHYITHKVHRPFSSLSVLYVSRKGRTVSSDEHRHDQTIHGDDTSHDNWDERL